MSEHSCQSLGYFQKQDKFSIQETFFKDFCEGARHYDVIQTKHWRCGTLFSINI